MSQSPTQNVNTHSPPPPFIIAKLSPQKHLDMVGALHSLALRCPERAARYMQLARHHEEMAKMVEVTT